MYLWRRLALCALIVMTMIGVTGAFAQADCPSGISGEDCDLFQSGLDELEALTSAQSLEVEFYYRMDTSFGEAFSQSATANGTAQFLLNDDGSIEAAQVAITDASSTASLMGPADDGTQSGVAGFIYVDDTFYFGSGDDLENLTWQSAPANGVELTFGDAVSQAFASGGFDDAWQREDGTTSLPGGTEAVVFTATINIEESLAEAMALMGGASESGDMGFDLGGLLEAMGGAGIGEAAGTAETSVALLVSPEGDLLGLGTQSIVAFDMASLMGLGDLGVEITGSGGTQLGMSSTNNFGVLFHSVNDDLTITAPEDAEPMSSADAGTVQSFAGSGLYGLLTGYYTMQAAMGGITDFGNDTTFTFSSDATELDNVNVIGPIEFGETIVADLEMGVVDGYTFEGEEGSAVQINMNADFDTYLELFGPDGTIVTYNDDFNSLNSQIGPYVLMQSGEYTIVARAFGNSSEGPYRLTLEAVEAQQPGTIESGETVFGNLLSGLQDHWTFAGETGQDVVIAVFSDDFDTYLELLDPDGRSIASNDDFNGLNSQIETTLPDDGDYTILVYGFSDTAAGSYELLLDIADATAQTDDGKGDETETTDAGGGDLAYGDSIDATLSEGAQDQYTFSGSEDDEITIVMTGDFDTLLELVDDSGNVVAANDDFDGRNSQIDFVLPADGVYTIIARSFANNSSGDYTLTLESANAETGDDTTVSAEPTVGPRGGDVIRQWASSAEATSEYGSDNWSAMQAAGEPNVDSCGDIVNAWASATSTEVASLTVSFREPVNPTEINIYQTFNPGSIVEVALIVVGEDEPVVVPDSADPPGNTDCPGVFTLDVTDVTGGLVEGMIITVDQSIVGSWNEIDAVELVGTP